MLPSLLYHCSKIVSLTSMAITRCLFDCSSNMGDRGVFCVSPHGRALDWGAVSHELHKGSASQVSFGPQALQASLLALGLKQAASCGESVAAPLLGPPPFQWDLCSGIHNGLFKVQEMLGAPQLCESGCHGNHCRAQQSPMR